MSRRVALWCCASATTPLSLMWQSLSPMSTSDVMEAKANTSSSLTSHESRDSAVRVLLDPQQRPCFAQHLTKERLVMEVLDVSALTPATPMETQEPEPNL